MASNILAFVLCLYVLHFAAAHRPEFREASQKCIQEGGLEEKQIEDFTRLRPVETDDPKIKCYFKCLLMETKFMTSEGVILEKPTGGVPHEFLPFIAACMNVEDKDLCQKAFNFHKCIVDRKEGN